MICLAIFLLAFSNIPNQEHSEVNSEDADLLMQNPNLFGGDIIGDFDDTRGAVSNNYRLWSGKSIPYEIEKELLTYETFKRLINEAIMQFERNTCVRFVKRTNEKNYVRIFRGPGCFAHIGRNKGVQILSLARGCWNLGSVVHELNHVVGFYHEQNRPDRDEYIKVFWENIKTSLDQTFNFLKFAPHRMRILNEFDYNSIMLYGERYFSKDGRSKTMEALKQGVSLINISSKPGLSKSDIFRINTLYN
ncbi:astacin-like metalloprotease toxin 5, partial [Centruroides sculpturatus]|uniref:astacin-like metalloprotease toxin 5 n=1 Tax=Centruroides sculpturatus TaxID=218467 RepID=UPI000C6EF664